MKAVRCIDHQAQVVMVPAPTGDGVRVKVASAGICGSDLHLISMWPLEATLGHEFAGFLSDGTAVAVEPLDPCWECDPCRNGDYHRCVRGAAMVIGVGLDGGMAEECVVPASSIVALPAGLSPRDACLVEPLAVAVHGIRRGDLRTSERVAIVGGGAIGLCAVAAARAVGARVDLAARHDAQRTAGQRLGAGTIADDASSTYDVVIDAAGTTESLQQCIHLAKPGARMILLATYWGGMQIPGFDLCMKEVNVIPSAQYNRQGPSRDVDVAATILATTPIVAQSLITHRFPLDAAAQAFAVAADRSAGAIKVVLEP
jgi:2-desacetyl-2-hydroxyethyl bacteriochlorophyllide A dehydrogenase